MIAVDTSALVAIARNEPEAAGFNSVMSDGTVLIGTPTLLETSMVLPSMLPDDIAERFFRRLLADPLIEPVAFSLELLEVAREAFRLYGKGRHPAKLNFGDCMSYALAKGRGVPLLYKGGDFALTDIRSALAP